MRRPGNPGEDGWLRATPVTSIKITCNGVPLLPEYDDVNDRLILDDPDLALPPVELCIDVAPDAPQESGTLADALTDVHTGGHERTGSTRIMISPYGTRVQLRQSGSPLELVENIPDDGVVLANPAVPHPTELRLEADDFVPKPDRPN